MKILLLISLVICCGISAGAQSVSVNTDGTAPNTSAMLDVKSTTKGILIPRMTTVQRTAIPGAAKGLLVYDTDNNSFWFYNGAAWNDLSGGGTAGSWTASGTNIYNSNTGNVGIGTSAPSNKLTIQTPINSIGWTHIGGADSIIVSEGVGGVSASIGTSTNHAFRLNANGQGRVSIYPTGDVVIGANSVGSLGKLTVQSLNNSYGISHLGEGGNVLATYMGGTSAGIGTFSHTNMRIFANGYSAIFVAEATGNVGMSVDDNNPLFKLDVGGRMRLRTENNGNSAGVWMNNPANTTPIAFMGIADPFTTGFYGNIAGWGLIMNVNTGNVGIGTLNPTYKLSVNGDIRSKEVVVETGWADYVFDDQYRLSPLDEVEKFIQQNKHLPNIPSSEEIEEKGLHLGDVQKRMMEKIEELTLYVIELKKEIEQIKSGNNENK